MADFTRRITGSEAVISVMKSIGLQPPVLVVGSTNKTANQMWELATDVGQQLCDIHDWQWLSQDHLITTVPGQALYPLPTGFDGYVTDAQWNRTTRLPIIGSLTEQEWQMLKARELAGTTFTMLFRVVNDMVELFDTPSTVQTLALPYRSRAWVLGAGDVPKDNLTENDDEVMFDPQLFKLALKVAWYTAKEFDTTAMQGAMLRLIAAAKAKDAPSRTLSLGYGGSLMEPLLGYVNIPDGGYGA